MKIVVTGACGFIGVNMCARLLKDGHEVLGLDNFYTSDRKKADTLFAYPSFSFLQKDITEPWDDIESSLEGADAICNLACPASPVWYMKDPIYTTKVSVQGILHALDYATKKKIPILHASTSEVYGDPLEHPQKETYYGNVNPIGPRSCYDEGKRIAESLSFDYHRQHGTEIKIIRIFNTYGPFMEANDGRVISNFICAALQGKDLEIYGEGTQTRSFCYVDDLVEGMTRFLFLENSAETGPINLGNTEELRILALVKELQKTFPSIQCTKKPLMQNDPKLRKPNIEQARAILGWSPKISLQEGLQRTIEWFSSFYGYTL